MVSYDCKKCKYSTKYKYDFNKHLKTKKHRVNENPIQQNENTYDKNIQKHPQNIQKHPQNIHKHPQNIHKHPDIYNCEYCQESFTNFSNKRRHELHRCKENTSVSNSIIIKQENQINKLEKEKENQIKSLEKAMEKQKKDMLKEMETQKKEMAKHIELLLTKVGNTTINNTQNNNVTININAFGNENLDFINEKLIKKLLTGYPNEIIPKLIASIHCNPEHIENMNVYVQNKKEPYVMISENGKWILSSKKGVTQKLIDKGQMIFDSKTYDMIFNKSETKKIDKFSYMEDEKYDIESLNIGLLNNKHTLSKIGLI